MKFRAYFAKVDWLDADEHDYLEEDVQFIPGGFSASALYDFILDALQKRYPDSPDLFLDDFWPIDREAYTLWRLGGYPALPEFEGGNDEQG